MRRFSSLALGVLVTLPCVVASDKKKDPDEIGNRDVGKGVNFYSLEKEIALGKQLAQEVERQAKIVDDPVIAGDSFANAINSPWWFLPRAFYGPSDFNVAHTLTINALYTIPTPKDRNSRGRKEFESL